MKKMCPSLRLLLAAILAVVSVTTHAQVSPYKKVVNIPGNYPWGSVHITTYDGGSMLLTATNDTITTQNYLTFVKTTATGTIQWHKRFGPVIASFKNFVQSPDSGYFVCYVDAGVGVSTYEVLKLDKYGNLVFHHELQHPGNMSIVGIPEVLAKNDGSFYVLCDLLDTINYNSLWHAFEISAGGNVVWSHCYNIYSSKSYHADVDTCANGDLVILGTLYDDITQLHYVVITRITSGGAPVWTKFYSDGIRSFGGASIVCMPGDFLMVGATTQQPVTFQGEMALMRTDGQGNPLWTFLLWNPGNYPVLTTLEPVENNCTVLAGANGIDGLLIKTDSSGLMLSKRVYPGFTFCSFDTLPGGIYSFLGYDFVWPDHVLMTTDQLGVGCDDSAVAISKAPVTMLVTQPASDTIITLTAAPAPLPEAFATIHVNELCDLDGIHETAGASLNVYPSPADETVDIVCSEPILYIEIINLQGQVVRVHSASASPHQSTVYVGDLVSGVYFLRVLTETGSSSQKIIVQHHQ